MRDKQEDDGFVLLVQRQSRFVFQVVYALLRNSHDAEDVAQETLLNLYRSGAWRHIEDERAFLARAAWRQAIDRVRADRRRRMGESDACEIASMEPDPEEAILRADNHAIVHQLIDSLPEELRQPLALSSIKELSSREIAVILNLPEGTVRTRLMRARQMLKQKLATKGENRYAR